MNYDSIRYAQLEQEPELSTAKKWFGIYRGIRFEINHFEIKGLAKPSWTHYILVSLDEQLSKENSDKLWLEPNYKGFMRESKIARYSYYDTAVGNIEFHGGCTYYQKESTVDDKDRRVKIGCDYQHLWDEDMVYDLGYVYGEVKKSIDSFIELFGPVKVRSWGDGQYRFIEEFATEKEEAT